MLKYLPSPTVESLIPFREVKARIPSSTPGTTIADSTLARWRDSGVRGTRLRCTRIGGRWYVREADLSAFIAALNADSPPSAPSGKRQAEVDAALDAAGF